MRGNQSQPVSAFCLLWLVCLLMAPAAGAFEFAYGPWNTFDQAQRRVTPVVQCPGVPAGYVAVGTKEQLGADPDVYVVYANLAGGTVWEVTYDVTSSNFEDEGVAIVEIPGKGFVFLSNLKKAGVWLPALTYIKCNGDFGWSTIYP